MPKQPIYPNPQVKPRGYSPGTRAGDLIFTSGQVSEDAAGKLVGAGDVGAQARQCFKNIEAVLAAAGAKMSDITKINCFLTRAQDVPAYAAVRADVFPTDAPASSTVIVTALVNPAYLVEIEAIASTEG